MTRLGVLFGGRSGEHEVSLMSATSVLGAIDQSKYEIVTIGITKEGEWLLYDGPFGAIEDGSWETQAREALAREPEKYALTVWETGGQSLKASVDFILPVLHGPFGEDGRLQGFLDMIDIPYGGSGVLGSSACMDKGISKTIFAQHGLPQVRYLIVEREEFLEDPEAIQKKIASEIGFPAFVKPANMGSSVGIGKAKNETELAEAIHRAAVYDRRIVVEEYINCREIETGILGNYRLSVAEVGEILPSAEFYDYHAKYYDGGLTKLCIPASITQEQRAKIQEIAKKAYKASDCAGFARVDFFMDQETDEIYLNEINTIPGFTRYSMFPLLWQACGVTYPELIERIIKLGYERYYAKDHWKTNHQ